MRDEMRKKCKVSAGLGTRTSLVILRKAISGDKKGKKLDDQVLQHKQGMWYMKFDCEQDKRWDDRWRGHSGVNKVFLDTTKT